MREITTDMWLAEIDRLKEGMWNISFSSFQRKTGEPETEICKTEHGKLWARYEAGERTEDLFNAIRDLNLGKNCWA